MSMKPQILFEDQTLLVIDKPSGLVVNRAESVKGATVQDWISEKLKVISDRPDSDFSKRNGIVHRIDKETSGCLIIAKTPQAFVELQRQFHDREIEKTYLSLVHGNFEMKSGVVKAEVGRLPWNRERFGVLSGGRISESVYLVKSTFNVDSVGTDYITPGVYSLVEWHPKTGRTHQIRVHAKYLHHPLVSDSFYAGRKTARRDHEWCPRLFLHASKITFLHPVNNKRITVESELPDDLRQVLEKLRNK